MNTPECHKLQSLATLVCPLAVLVCGGVASAQLSLGNQFNTALSHVGLGYDVNANRVWVYQGFDSTLRSYSPTGVAGPTIARPGQSANDADIEIPAHGFTLGTTAVPANSLVFIDGESGVAEIYAVNPLTGAPIASLVTAFGASHVVGGSYHPQRQTFFLVQDRVPGGAIGNRIAEINCVTGAVIQTFSITTARPTFTVNFGDMAVAGNGNLLVVSSDEGTIGEFTPTGEFLRELALPVSVSSLSGIGFDASRCEIWVASTDGPVTRLAITAGDSLCGAPACSADFDNDGEVNPDDLADYIGAYFAQPPGAGADFNTDGAVDPDDLADYIGAFFNGC